MNRRQRHERIITNFGSIKWDHHPRFHFDALIARRGLAALNDAAVSELAADLWHSRVRQNRMNKANKERRARTVPK